MNNAVLIDIAFITVISNILYQINVGLVNRRYLFKNIAVQKPLIGRLYITEILYCNVKRVCVCGVCVCVCYSYILHYNIDVPLTSEMMATPLVECVLDKYKLIDFNFTEHLIYGIK